MTSGEKLQECDLKHLNPSNLVLQYTVEVNHQLDISNKTRTAKIKSMLEIIYTQNAKLSIEKKCMQF